MIKVLRYLFVAALFLSITTPTALAEGTWTDGQDTYHVPMSWCIVQGTPAQDSPNIAGDTETDALIWRRHERPTDNIFVNPTGITLRSAINNAWTVLDYPIINDPTITAGTQEGDIRGEDVNTFGTEFNQIINDCDAAYASPNFDGGSRAGIGITAVNVGLFHDAGPSYVTVIGWGGCAQDAAGNCAIPFDGRIAVIDNVYLHPSSPDRTWPGSATQFSLTDPFDQLVGHEVGHALSLPHRNPLTALMNGSQRDNDGNGTADNIALNAAEVTALRTNAQNVPGVEIDPPGVFNPGRFVAMRQVDKVQERDDIPPHLDLASVRAAFDKEQGLFFLDQQLFGLLPAEGEPQQAWFLVDVDGPNRGATPQQLRQIGLPASNFIGADFVAQVDAVATEVRGTAWLFRDGDFFQIDEMIPQLLTLIMYPHTSEATGPSGELPENFDRGFPVHHIINIQIPADIIGIKLEQPFRVQTLNVVNGEQIVDALAEDDSERVGVDFILEDPQFPHCFQETPGKPGDTIQIRLEGLLPDQPIHGLLGADLVFTGQSDANGGGIIDFPLPANAIPGFHLVTVGIDETALTADCIITIDGDGPRTGEEEFSLLKSHEDLLHGQERLLDRLGSLIQQLADQGELTQRELLDLTQRYEQLLQTHTAMVEQFGKLIEEFMK